MESENKAMGVYEQIVNAESAAPEELARLVEELKGCDESGQYLCSGARYLRALSPEKYAPHIEAMVEAAIERDREHRYISQLLAALWGEDFMEKAPQLKITDNNFRRIFKRIYPSR